MPFIHFNNHYRSFNILSVILIILSLIFLIFKGLNYGVDFKGGTLIEIRVSNNNTDISDFTITMNNHRFNTGDKLIYQNNGYSNITNLNNINIECRCCSCFSGVT